MRSSHQDILDRWLRAERDDRGDEADAALLALLSTLPALHPPAGFADRVMARAGLAAVAVAAGARRSFFAPVWVRALLTLCLLAIGASALWLPQTLRAFAGLLSLGDLVRLWSGSVVAACSWLASALGMWDFVLTVGRALATPLETPTVALAMVSCLLVSMVAFRFLRNLITRDRSWTHELI
jgi:AcrR family transcriptional regulator